MEKLLGSIKLFGGNFAPDGYMLCEGEMLSIANYTALFSILGTTYGGDGKVTFALPNLAPINGAIYIIAITGIFPSRG
jgi:microcystin-dependent protein